MCKAKEYNFEATKILKSVIRQRYCFPGGYERFVITSDGAAICAKCCKKEYKIILHSTLLKYRDGWQVVASSNESELEDMTSCDHCGYLIHFGEEVQND